MTLAAAKQAIRRILDQIDGLDTDEAARRKFKRLVSETCLAHGINGIDRCERVYFTRRLLDAKVSRTTIRDRLMSKFDVSRSQAYRIIGLALQLSRKSDEFGTRKDFNDV